MLILGVFLMKLRCETKDRGGAGGRKCMVSTFIWILLSCLVVDSLLVSDAGAVPEANMMAGSVVRPQGPAVNSEKEGKLSFMGMAEPWESYSVVLLPGESVAEVHVKRGELVEKGAPLISLHNDQLDNSIGDLTRKKNEVDYNIQQATLLVLEIELKEKYLARIDEQIKKEGELAEKVPGYSSQLAKKLKQQRIQLVDQLTLLKARNRIAEEVSRKNKELESTLQEQIDRLIKRREQLHIKAPFSGKIFYVVDDPGRTTPGRPVCELWNETSMLVRGKIMQHQYAYVHLGDRVRISMEFSPEKKLDGVVHSIEQGMAREGDPRLMQGYATFSVLIRVDDPEWLKPGMMVSAELISSISSN